MNIAAFTGASQRNSAHAGVETAKCLRLYADRGDGPPGGFDTLRYGPLKPVGLADPKTGLRPYAVIQLRRDDKDGSLYNLVGFQTHLTFGEQKRIFSMIPGLGKAEFERYGVMHRNTFINSPQLLTGFFESRITRTYFLPDRSRCWRIYRINSVPA